MDEFRKEVFKTLSNKELIELWNKYLKENIILEDDYYYESIEIIDKGPLFRIILESPYGGEKNKEMITSRTNIIKELNENIDEIKEYYKHWEKVKEKLKK